MIIEDLPENIILDTDQVTGHRKLEQLTTVQRLLELALINQRVFSPSIIANPRFRYPK